MYYRRQLPHYQPDDATYFVTFRLAGSLPMQVLIDLQEEHKSQLRRTGSKRERVRAAQEREFVHFDGMLDRQMGSTLLVSDPRVAGLVAEAMHYRDGRMYDLICFCIMPNHVHLVFSVARRDSSRYIVADILENLKWYTALMANKILGRNGQFWQHESYDHVVRSDEELGRIVAYVLANPTKAGLVKDEAEWPWSYLKRDFCGGPFISERSRG